MTWNTILLRGKLPPIAIVLGNEFLTFAWHWNFNVFKRHHLCGLKPRLFPKTTKLLMRITIGIATHCCLIQVNVSQVLGIQLPLLLRGHR